MLARAPDKECTMGSLLIAVIYLAFISLGLPDSLLGAAWPVMHRELGANVSWAGVVTMIISVCTIASALSTDKLAAKMGTPLVVACSVLLTAAAMLAFSLSSTFWQLCLFAVPYGLGAGAIDTSLNNYVAKHLAARHMNWLHCCWGVGAVVGPYVMGACLTGAGGWQSGYLVISLVQFALTLVMFLSIPLWKREKGEGAGQKETALPLRQTFLLKGAVFVFLAGLFYFAIEQLPIVWASTYFSEVYALETDTAAFLASLFYIGIAVSRAVSGFFAEKAGDRNMIRIGTGIVIGGAALIAVALPFGAFAPAVAGFIAVGLGCGPIFPCMLHATPTNFGAAHSGSVIGVQMAFAYCGMTFTPILFGKLAEATTIRLLPFGVALLAGLVLLFTELLNRSVDKRRAADMRR